MSFHLKIRQKYKFDWMLFFIFPGDIFMWLCVSLCAMCMYVFYYHCDGKERTLFYYVSMTNYCVENRWTIWIMSPIGMYIVLFECNGKNVEIQYSMECVWNCPKPRLEKKTVHKSHNFKNEWPNIDSHRIKIPYKMQIYMNCPNNFWAEPDSAYIYI